MRVSKIVYHARKLGRWETNPYLEMMCLQRVIVKIQYPKWEKNYRRIEELFWKFKIYKLDPCHSQEEIKTRFQEFDAKLG
jgi:hypothetical protein